MTGPETLDVARDAICTIVVVSSPLMVVGLVVGVVVSLFQALTQIQEQTLSFAIKLIAVVITIFATAGWLGGMIFEYSVVIFDTFPQLVK